MWLSRKSNYPTVRFVSKQYITFCSTLQLFATAHNENRWITKSAYIELLQSACIADSVPKRCLAPAKDFQFPRAQVNRQLSTCPIDDESVFLPLIRIPLNDDRQEKASRFQSRQALHERQMNEIKAAASTPQRRSRPAGNDSPLGKENEDDPIFGNSTNTPLKRVPLLANFEEWMRMATDNVIYSSV